MNPFLQRILMTIALFISVLVFPWYVSVVFAAFLIIYLPFYIEALFFGFFFDRLYASASPYTGLVAVSILILIVMFVRPRIRT